MGNTRRPPPGGTAARLGRRPPPPAPYLAVVSVKPYLRLAPAVPTLVSAAATQNRYLPRGAAACGSSARSEEAPPRAPAAVPRQRQEKQALRQQDSKQRQVHTCSKMRPEVMAGHGPGSQRDRGGEEQGG